MGMLLVWAQLLGLIGAGLCAGAVRWGVWASLQPAQLTETTGLRLAPPSLGFVSMARVAPRGYAVTLSRSGALIPKHQAGPISGAGKIRTSGAEIFVASASAQSQAGCLATRRTAVHP